jgi:hypothetical protein
VGGEDDNVSPTVDGGRYERVGPLEVPNTPGVG